MPASYVGLYVQRAEDRTVNYVHVVDSDGNTIPVKPEVYRERGSKPPIEHLPDEKDYLAGRSSSHGFPS